MADSTTNLEQIDSGQAQNVVTANMLFDAASPATIYGRHGEACSGLVWGYYGGRWAGTLVANGTITLAANATNYLMVDRNSGVVQLDDGSPLSWSDVDIFAHLYVIVTNASGVVSYEDHRAGPGGLFSAGGGGGGSFGGVVQINEGGTGATTAAAARTALGVKAFLLTYVQLQANRSVGNNTFAKESWSSGAVIVDEASAWAAGNPTRLTTPAGCTRAEIFAYGQWNSNSTGVRWINLYCNGTYIRQFLAPASFESGRAVATLMVNLVAGDYFEIEYAQSSGGSLNLTGGAGNVSATNFGVKWYV